MNKYRITAQAILAGENLEPIENGYIVVEDNIITKVGTKEQLTSEEQQYTLIDLKDKTIMPGLIDCHSHAALDARIPGHLEMLSTCNELELGVMGIQALEDDLMAGITTARCLGDLYDVDLTIKKMIQEGKAKGPRLLVAGTAMRGSHGGGYVARGHCGVDEFCRTARENLKKGVDVLKLFITPGIPAKNISVIPCYVTKEEIRTVVEEGKRLGITTAAHCIGGQGLRYCVEEGVDVIEHAYLATKEDAQIIKNSKSWVGLTTGIFMDETREEFLSDENVDKVHFYREDVEKSMRILMEEKVPFVLGTDAYHGLLYREAEFAVKYGASVIDAVKGLTVNAAAICGVGKITGQLAKGMHADIIAVDGNPLENVSCLKDVTFIMKDGVVYK